jgi:hypothetical protein
MDKQNKADKASSTGAHSDATAGKPSWDHINTDLKSALDTWTELTGKMANKLSPEEVQLREIKSILGTLKDKLKAFEDDDQPAQATPAAAATSTAPTAPEKP